MIEDGDTQKLSIEAVINSQEKYKQEYRETLVDEMRPAREAIVDYAMREVRRGNAHHKPTPIGPWKLYDLDNELTMDKLSYRLRLSFAIFEEDKERKVVPEDFFVSMHDTEEDERIMRSTGLHWKFGELLGLPSLVLFTENRELIERVTNDTVRTLIDGTYEGIKLLPRNPKNITLEEKYTSIPKFTVYYPFSEKLDEGIPVEANISSARDILRGMLKCFPFESLSK